jgi:hypothetical protein
MKRVLGGLLGAVLFLSCAGAEAAESCRPAAHDCCGKTAPAPKTPCAAMPCCRVAAPQSTVAIAPVVRTVAALPAPVSSPKPESVVARASFEPAAGPPDPPLPARPGRSPPPARQS